MPQKILVVEDEPSIKELIELNLRHAGFEAIGTDQAEIAWQLLAQENPDIVLLDWVLPGMSGFQLIRHIRADGRWREVPVIMLTARSDEVDMIAALDVGADDYVTKPFSPRELIARIRSMIRCRDARQFSGIVELGGLRLITDSRKLYVGDHCLSFGPTEFRLLHFFMTHAERVHSRAQLLDFVWGGGYRIDERTIDVHVRRLRSVLENHALDGMLQTVRGLGYRFSLNTSG
jgi:two-component system phosphate regulon response regulator PhoB